ncbi:MAG: alpha/beta hydrolase fold domain-containing protein, partial [Boseongicola sp. SB0673_bin_14]|nr:alpha/beta hydrolase fold domain-containing protein [Boseongicola sp. SB0673_bin_14]
TSLPDILEDAQSALDWVISNAEACGIDRTQIHLSGNSAGAQLAAMVAAQTEPGRVASLTLISGLYDLLPLLDEEPNSWLNPVDRFESPGKNHMEIIIEIGTPGTPVFAALERQLKERRNRLECQ